MLSSAELIEFVDHIVKLRTKCVEHDGKFSLLLLHVHEKAEKGGDQVIPSIVKKFRIHSSFLFNTGLFSHFSWVNIFLFSSFRFLLFFLLLFGHCTVLSYAKLFSRAFWQSQSLEHLLKLVLEFSAWTSRSCKLRLELLARLFDSQVFRAIL